MKRRTRFGFFGFLTIDYRAAQAYLDKMASEGWALARVWLGMAARFRRTDRTDLHYDVDIAQPVAEDTPEYRALCREAGWERLYTVRYMNIYRSLPGAETRPIRPENGETFRRYRSNAVRWAITCAAVMVLLSAFLGVYVWVSGVGSVMALLRLGSVSAALTLLLALVPGVLLGGGIYVVCSLRRASQWRKVERTGTEKIPPVPRARLRGCLTLFSYLGTGLLIAAAAADLVTFPQSLPLVLLGIGTACLFLLVLCAEQERLRQPKRVWMKRCAALGCAVLAIGLVRWNAIPVFEEQRAGAAADLPILEGARYEKLRSAASVLLSGAEGRAIPEEDAEGEIRVACWVCPNEGLARFTLRMLRYKGMEPAGEDGWRLETEERTVWLCRDGLTVRIASVTAGAEVGRQVRDWVMGRG